MAKDKVKDFISDEEAASLEAPDFIPDEALNPRRTLSPIEAGVSGLAKGLTFGFSDEIAAAGRAGVGKLTGDKSPYGDLYDKYLKEQRAYQDAAKADSPIAFTASEIGGAIVGPGKFFAPAKGASVAANVARAGLGGGIVGVGTSEEKSVKGLAEDALKGAAIGGATQYGLDKIGQGISRLKPSSLNKFAEEKAVKAAGAMTKEMRDLEAKGQLHKIGRELLDKKIVTIKAGLEDVIERSGAIKKESGKKIGEILSAADDLVENTTKMIENGKLLGFLPEAQKNAAKEYMQENFGFSMKNVANRLQQEIIAPNIQNPLLKTELSRVAAIADDFAALPAQSLKAANIIKGTQGAKTKFDAQTVPEAFKKQVYKIIKEEIDGAVNKVSKLEDALLEKGVNVSGLLQLPGVVADGTAQLKKILGPAYEQAKKDFGMSKSVGDMAFKRLGGVRSNRGVSLTDTIMAASGFASGGPVTGIALGALNKFGRRYGNTFQAVGADKLAKVLSRSPDALGRFGDTLARAAQENPLSLIAAHLALSKDPDYTNILNNFEKEQRSLSLPGRAQGIQLPGSR